MEEYNQGVDFDDTFNAIIFCLLYREQMKYLARWLENLFQGRQMF